MLDCTTPKFCAFKGEGRRFVKPEEPIYMTSTLVEEILKDYDSKVKDSGPERGNIMSAIIELLEMIEHHFSSKMSVYGPGPLDQLRPYHQGIRILNTATGQWRKSNAMKDQTQFIKRKLESFENPNKERKTLERFKKYLLSKDRLSALEKFLSFSRPDSPRPTDGEFTECAQFILGELVAATGCRAVVLLHLTVGSYYSKTPGFSPFEVSPEDSILDEEKENIKIYRRVNPNLPPKGKGCRHQVEENFAICPVQCEDRYDPVGYNIYVDWNKTQGTKGATYLHIPTLLKICIDCFALIRANFFKGRKLTPSGDDSWLQDEETPLFVNSAGSSIEFIDLTRVSEALGVKVTSITHRQTIATWAVNHASEEIRKAEEEALAHSPAVAKEVYMQNKQQMPQTLTQVYMKEENFLPRSFKDQIEVTEKVIKTHVEDTEKSQAKQQYLKLLKDKEERKKLMDMNRPLGPRHRVLGVNRDKFRVLMMELCPEVITSIDTMKPLQWRNKVVRSVCTASGQSGDDLRNVWKDVYKGDLKHGVRDRRFAAKSEGWPSRLVQNVTWKRDRNSWISATLRKSLLSNDKH